LIALAELLRTHPATVTARPARATPGLTDVIATVTGGLAGAASAAAAPTAGEPSTGSATSAAAAPSAPSDAGSGRPASPRTPGRRSGSRRRAAAAGWHPAAGRRARHAVHRPRARARPGRRVRAGHVPWPAALGPGPDDRRPAGTGTGNHR